VCADWCRLARCALLGATAALAIAGARSHAGSWNDGSRLAAAESLIDAGTWTIDRSIFVDPARRPASAPPPYLVSDPRLMSSGTLDKIYVGGHFFSDKTPVPNLFLAGEYLMLQRVGGVVARLRADRFCYWLTLLSAGLSYVIATSAMFVVAWRATGSLRLTIGAASSFAFATCAAAYSRHVNSHEMLLGLFALLIVQLDAAERERTALRAARTIAIGTLAGLSYSVDAALGPLALTATLAFVARHSRARVAAVAVASLAAAPWVLLHHALNYHVGHTLRPANAVADYLMWPGSPFDPTTMTGYYAHATASRAIGYSVDLLLGRRGFLLHNLPLLLTPLALWRLLRAAPPLQERPLILYSAALLIGGWLSYALTSTNHSGEALSIRWYVPLLAPAFYLLIIDLRESERARIPFALLSITGAGMAATAWTSGPWQPRVPLFWWWVSAAFVSWAVTSTLLRLWPPVPACPRLCPRACDRGREVATAGARLRPEPRAGSPRSRS
jgi:hypothetical protein